MGDALVNAAGNGKVDDLVACLDSGADIETKDKVRTSSTDMTL